MKFILLAIPVVASLAGCADPIKAGPQPHGFILGDRMHYLRPTVSRMLYGPEIKDPVSSDYVVTDKDGNVYVSPKLLNKVRP